MAQNEYQKLKLISLLRILHEESDEEHPLPMQDILSRLETEYGIRAERKSIYRDIEALRNFGFSIETVPGKNGGYYLAQRLLTLPELKLLVDAVQASKFITRSKSTELIHKLSGLLSHYEARRLSRQVYVANRVKAMNEEIYFIVDELHRAMQENRQITFHYFDWNEKKERVLRHDGALYQVSPWLLTWEDENYYLIAYDASVNRIKHYRADRILDIHVTEQARLGRALFDDFDAAQFSKKVFGMFGGEETRVVLQCDNSLAGVIFDRFGQDVTLIPQGEHAFHVAVPVLVSPQFFAWATGFGARLTIVSPASVRQQMCDFLADVAGGYGSDAIPERI